MPVLLSAFSLSPSCIQHLPTHQLKLQTAVICTLAAVRVRTNSAVVMSENMSCQRICYVS